MTKENKPTIGLNMIVKNEETVIKRVLDSVKDLIDWYTIVDTGSTDNTKKIIKETMEFHGIPGEIHDHEWVNFCDARNRALKEIKGKADWGFWIDADEVLEIQNDFSKDELFKEFEGTNRSQINVYYGGMSYFRDQFFKIECDWTWKGAVHESMYLKSGEITSGNVSNLRTIVHAEGNSWGNGSKEAQKAKYTEHAEMLEEYIKTDENPRWVFYLAQSYRDAFEWDKAIEWYSKRLELGGYWEERYFSQYSIGNCFLKSGKIADAIDAFAKCTKYDHRRAEHYIPIILHYQRDKNYIMAYAISKIAMDTASKNPYPNSSLFLEPSVYLYKLMDLHMVNCSHLSKAIELKKYMPSLQKLLLLGKIPPNDSSRIAANMNIYKKQTQFTI